MSDATEFTKEPVCILFLDDNGKGHVRGPEIFKSYRSMRCRVLYLQGMHFTWVFCAVITMSDKPQVVWHRYERDAWVPTDDDKNIVEGWLVDFEMNKMKAVSR